MPTAKKRKNPENTPSVMRKTLWIENRLRSRVSRKTIKTAPGIVPHSSKMGMELAP